MVHTRLLTTLLLAGAFAPPVDCRRNYEDDANSNVIQAQVTDTGTIVVNNTFQETTASLKQDWGAHIKGTWVATWERKDFQKTGGSDAFPTGSYTKTNSWKMEVVIDDEKIKGSPSISSPEGSPECYYECPKQTGGCSSSEVKCVAGPRTWNNFANKLWDESLGVCQESRVDYTCTYACTYRLVCQLMFDESTPKGYTILTHGRGMGTDFPAPHPGAPPTKENKDLASGVGDGGGWQKWEVEFMMDWKWNKDATPPAWEATFPSATHGHKLYALDRTGTTRVTQNEPYHATVPGGDLVKQP